MFGFLLPVPLIGGVGARAAIVVLILYGLLPIVRTTITGIAGIDPTVREAGVAMGMTPTASCCASSNCRWRCRRSSRACAWPPSSASARRRSRRRSAPEAWASTSTAACRWSTHRDSGRRDSCSACWRWRSTAGCCGSSGSCRRDGAQRRAEPPLAAAAVLAAGALVAGGVVAARSAQCDRRRIEELHRAGHPRRAGRADDRARHRAASAAPTESRRHADLRSRADQRRHRRLRRIHGHGADGRVSRAGEHGSAAAVFEHVREQYAHTGRTLLPPLGFDNTFAILVRGQDARALGLRTIDDAARVAPRWKAGFGYEFLERPDGYPGLAKTYGLQVHRRASRDGSDAQLSRAGVRAGRSDRWRCDRWPDRRRSISCSSRTIAITFRRTMRRRLRARRPLLKYPQIRGALESLAGRVTRRRHAADELRRRRGASGCRASRPRVSGCGTMRFWS